MEHTVPSLLLTSFCQAYADAKTKVQIVKKEFLLLFLSGTFQKSDTSSVSGCSVVSGQVKGPQRGLRGSYGRTIQCSILSRYLHCSYVSGGKTAAPSQSYCEVDRYRSGTLSVLTYAQW